MKELPKIDKTLYDSCSTYANLYIQERLTKDSSRRCFGDACIQKLCDNCRFYKPYSYFSFK